MTGTLHPTAIVHPSAIVDEGAKIGAGSRIWHWAHICGGARIDERCSFGQNVFVGNNCKVQNNVSLYDAVTLEDDVFCGPSMVFTNVYNPRSAVIRKDEYRRTLVKKGATIGANATLVCGITLGEYASSAPAPSSTTTSSPMPSWLGYPPNRFAG